MDVHGFGALTVGDPGDAGETRAGSDVEARTRDLDEDGGVWITSSATMTWHMRQFGRITNGLSNSFCPSTNGCHIGHT